MFNRLRLATIICAMYHACTPAFANVNGGFSTSDDSCILYLRLTQTDHSLSGYLVSVSATDDTNTGFSVRKIDNITGSVSANTISLRIKGLFGLSDALMDGSIHGNRLILEMPTNDGHLEKAILVLTSADSWNQKLKSFETRRMVYANKLLWHNLIVGRVSYLISDYQNATTKKSAAEARLPKDNAKLDSLKSLQERISAKLNETQLKLKSIAQIAAEKRTKADQTQDAADSSTAAEAEAIESEGKSDLVSLQADLSDNSNNIAFVVSAISDDNTAIHDSTQQIVADTAELILIKSPYKSTINDLQIKTYKTQSQQVILQQPNLYSKVLFQTSVGEIVHIIPCGTVWSIAIIRPSTLCWLAPPRLFTGK